MPFFLCARTKHVVVFVVYVVGRRRTTNIRFVRIKLNVCTRRPALTRNRRRIGLDDDDRKGQLASNYLPVLASDCASDHQLASLVRLQHVAIVGFHELFACHHHHHHLVVRGIRRAERRETREKTFRGVFVVIAIIVGEPAGGVSGSMAVASG